jgi:hypothetical protein
VPRCGAAFSSKDRIFLRRHSARQLSSAYLIITPPSFMMARPEILRDFPHSIQANAARPRPFDSSGIVLPL